MAPRKVSSALCGLLLFGCATAAPTATKTIFVSESTLSALEDQMAAFCESAFADPAACASARKADNDAYAAMMGIRAAQLAGTDPSKAITDAQIALQRLADAVSTVAKGK